MKTGHILFSFVILLGLLAGMAVPVARAQGTGTITFHVLSAQNFATPDDVEDTMDIEGVLITPFSGGGLIRIQNLCEGVGCTSQDIYYKIEMSITWTSDWGHDYPTWYTAPKIEYSIGGETVEVVLSDYCGGPTGNMSGCLIEGDGMIEAANISEEPEPPFGGGHEFFEVGYHTSYGGLYITNSYKITFSTSPIGDEELSCAGQYNLGAEIGRVTLNATDSVGRDLRQQLGSNYPAAGTWYAVRVSSGTWKNNGAGADLTDIGLKVGSSGTWFPLGTNPSVECVNGETYYLQMSASLGATYLRVYDTDGNFVSNTGSVTVTIYNVAARTRYLDGCELQYEVGDLIEQKTVQGNQPTGIHLDSPKQNRPVGGGGVPYLKRYFMLETIGGPVNLGTDGYTYDVDLGIRANETINVPDEWHFIATAPFVTCVHSTDMAGHFKAFFVLDEATDEPGLIFETYYYSLRARDTGSYTDNSGTISYRLYQASFMQLTVPGDVPPVDGCLHYTHAATQAGSISINGNDDDGTLLPVLVPNGLYALDVQGGPWKNNGVDSFAVQISDDNGDTWADLEDYPNLLCAASADGNHVIIYLYLAAGKTWRARVSDPGDNFGDNTLSISLKIYTGTLGINVWPTCQNGYTLTEIPLGDEWRKLPGESAKGKTLTGITKGYRYALEITGDAMWYEGGSSTGSYLVEITDDTVNGAGTFQDLETYSGNVCAEQIGEGGRFRVIFTAQSNGYLVRVRDGDNDFLSNTGYVMYRLYEAAANGSNNDPNPPIDTKPPPEWVVACNERYARPSSWITWYGIIPVPRVGEWLDYLRAAITYYFAWCPQHTESLMNIGQVYTDKEPLASIQDLMDFVKSIQTTLEGYQATGGESMPVGLVSQEPDLFSDTGSIGQAGGGDTYKVPSAAGPWDLFMVGNEDPSSSIWFGGQVDFTSSIGTTDLSVNDDYQALCSMKFYPLFGINADPYCSLMSLIRYSHIMTLLLLVIDFVVVLWLGIKYLPKYFIRFISLIGRVGRSV